MIKIRLLLASLVLAFAVAGLFLSPVIAAPTAIGWSTGWDLTNVTFAAFPASEVIYNTDTPRRLVIQYVLRGTNVPNTVHRVGFHIFLPSISDCLSSFGTITGFTSTSGSTGFLGTLNPAVPCYVVTRQGHTASVESFLVGDLKIDSTGAGDLTITIDDAPAGTYAVEFDFRQGIGCPPNNCWVQLQAPGPTFSVNTVTITIREWVAVGGFIEPVNRLSIIAPYVTLFALVAAAAVVTVKPWKKPEN